MLGNSSSARQRCKTYPDTSSLPIVWNSERLSGACSGLPAMDASLNDRLGGYDDKTWSAYPVAWPGTALPAFRSVNICFIGIRIFFRGDILRKESLYSLLACVTMNGEYGRVTKS